jgi:hypothetical protein
MKLLLLLILISCGSDYHSHDEVYSSVHSVKNDPYYDHYRLAFLTSLQRYATDAEIDTIKHKLMNIPISSKLPEDIKVSADVAGICVNRAYIVIMTPKNTANNMNLGERFTVYHELAHCVLNLPHYDKVVGDLMNSRVHADNLFFNDDYILRWLDSL